MPEKVNGNKFSGKSNIASLNSSSTSIDSKSAVQLNSTEHKLATLQKMADNSPYSQRFAQLKSLVNNSTQKQPVSQLSKDSHSLPDNVKQGVESLSGISMDDVKVHYNSAKPAQLNAHAYAQGTYIHIASGQEKHLPHEAWHVVQQKQGRVRPTTMMKAKVPVNDDQGLEKEADVMGARALQMKPFSLSDYKTGKSVQRKGVVQKVDDELSQEFDRQVLENERNKPVDNLGDTFDLQQAMETRDRKAISGDGGVLRDAERARPSELNEAQISALKLVKLKFNFAGSSEHKWDRGIGTTGIHSPSPEGYKKDKHNSGGEKMVKEKEYLGGKKMVFEYAGPVKALIGSGSIASGALDSGDNSTENNLEDAKQIIIKAITTIDLIRVNIGGRLLPKIEKKISNVKIDIDIKGFSRGGATASTFAAWIKSTYPENFNVNLLLIDPVDGGRLNTFSKNGAKMKNKVDVSGVYDEGKDDDDGKDTTGSTLVIPVKSNSDKSVVARMLRPQEIKGAQRIIIVYGSKAAHTALYKDALGKPRYFKWNGETVKGMGLTKLPPGLYVVNSDTKSLDIKKITKTDWDGSYKKIILGEANVWEGRVSAIEKEVMELLERKFLKVETTRVD